MGVPMRRLGRFSSTRLAGLRSAVVLIFLLALWGCTGGGDVVDAQDGGADASDATNTPQVRVGGANDQGKGFVDWSDDKATPAMLRGIQGGQHIWFSVKARNVSAKKLRMAVTLIVDETTKAVIPGRVEYTSTPPEVDGWYLYQGARAYVKCPCQVVGRKLRVDLEVVDLYGRTASEQVWITPTWDGNCDFDPAGSCKKQ